MSLSERGNQSTQATAGHVGLFHLRTDVERCGSRVPNASDDDNHGDRGQGSTRKRRGRNTSSKDQSQVLVVACLTT